MVLLILAVLGHPVMLLFHALHWSAGEYPEAVVRGILAGVLPESGRAQMEVLLAWTPPDGTPGAGSRRAAAETEEDYYSGATEEEKTWATAAFFAQWVAGLAITVVVTYLVACKYKGSITDRRVQWQGLFNDPGLQNGGFWKYDLCTCCQDRDYCLYGFCCLGCRIGDTYTMTNVGPSYMTYIHAFVALEVIAQVFTLLWTMIAFSLGVEGADNVGSLGYYVGELFLAAWLAGQRKKLRQALGDPSPDAHCVMDFCLYWWCGCCTAVQEARQVDEITQTRVTCCLQLQFVQPVAAPPAVVGQPASAGPVMGTVVAPAGNGGPPEGNGGMQYGGTKY